MNGNSDDGATYTAIAGDTLHSMASALAAAINTSFPAMSAAASGAVISVTNNDTVGYHIASHVGNVSNVKETVTWAIRSMQINVWCGDLTSKFAFQQTLETLFAQPAI